MELPDLRVEGTPSVQRIGIIGAGAAGLAALKIILDTPQFKAGAWIPVAYEAREQVGGVWLPALPTDNPPLTPLYDSLTTNLPHPVMAFTSFSFPPETPVFPKAHIVETYLQSYAKHFDLLRFIQFRTTIDVVERLPDSNQWRVKLSTGNTEILQKLVVANGHYRVPRYPEIPGLAKWRQANKAIHSAWYRHPTHDYGETVLVIGAGPSGSDISTEMAANGTVVIHSVRGSTSEDTGNIKRRGQVVEFRDDGEVLFEDGKLETGITGCILATGYQVAFPFLSESLLQNALPPPIPPIPHGLYNSTFHVFPLAKYIFPLQYEDPNIAFLGLLVRVAPFPLLEAQARAMVHVFANPSALDTTVEAVDIMSRYTDLAEEFGSEDPLVIAHAWNRFKDHEQFDYRDRMYEFADASTQKDTIGITGRIVVPDWEKRMYGAKDVLRQFWVHLEKKGWAEAWVKDVGKGGPHEWVDLLERMLKEATEDGETKGDNIDGDKSKL
ncbi:flavin-binding monooxygenase-like-domain-containing protein [Rhodocollybia butyracea]|uniref:Flavin-binding monooxygenase-like-domain-containing protein n=1 Tax=Rhodocollybia butyracea TaxID=206335 RepID=A0A9P5QAS2_9AGAR|nr:flavin-binding monooxygenase-like-domain-containing protein [Rhodocollybia butyracea]